MQVTASGTAENWNMCFRSKLRASAFCSSVRVSSGTFRKRASTRATEYMTRPTVKTAS